MTLQILESARLAWNSLAEVFPDEGIETYSDMESFENFYEVFTKELLDKGEE